MRLQQLAEQLWPYLQKFVERTARATGNSGGGGVAGGAPSPHALSGAHHSGTLADSQAPQFLMTDGSRTLNGNLAVAAGKTLDGVDLSVHAADPDAHHARVTASSGITVTGQLVSLLFAASPGLEISGSGVRVKAYNGILRDSNGVSVQLQGTSGLDLSGAGLAIADSIAGGGLIIASKVLAVNPGDGIDIVSDAVTVDVTDIIDTMAGLGEDGSNNIQVKRHSPDSGLAFGLSGGLTLGTPISSSVSSTNAVSGVGHSHAVTASSDVGTTPAAALLKSTGAGGLILASLNVKGSVDITNGGDLYVAGSIGGASGIVITLGDRVGFGRIPDPQFTVDVNGPLRADYLIGKHAIQLDGVLLLSHWDGGDPYNTNFTGEPNGHKGQPATLTGGVHFRPGKFYKGAVFGPAKTNYCTNPSFETGTTGWAVVNGGTWSRINTDSAYGSYCIKGVVGSTSHAYVYSLSGQTPGAIFVVSAWMKRDDLTGICRFYASDSGYGNSSYSGNVVGDDGWVRKSAVYTVQADGVVRIVFCGDPGTIYIDAVQIEASFLSPYIDGSLTEGPGLITAGHSWAGTAHASNSSRQDAWLSYPTDENIRADRGTIMCWVYVEGNTGNSQGILEAGSAWPYFALYMTGDIPTFIAGNASGYDTLNGPAPVGGGYGRWVHVAATWDYYNNQMRVYTDGVPNPSIAGYDNLAALASTIRIGRTTTLSNRNFNGIIDDLVILDRVSPPDEVMAVYESDAPVFAESSVFVFRATPTGLVWADERGLWMRDVDGNAVLGAYGGEAATYSWGGRSLAKGDIAFGRYGASDGGWLYFDRDGVSSKPFMSLGYADKTILALDAGGATLDGVLDISTTGGIYQGTGTFASPTTGLKIWNASGIGRIGGYNGGTAQWYANTDGKLYAGGGNVALDATGIAIKLDAYNALRFLDGSNNQIGRIYQYTQSTPNRYTLSLEAGHTTRDGEIRLIASDTGNNIVSTVSVGAAAGDGIGLSTYSRTIGIYANNDYVFMGPRVHMFQGDSSGAMPVLELEQLDLSEEFIKFTTTTGASNPFSTAAVGTYYGKVRVRVDGVLKWMAVWN